MFHHQDNQRVNENLFSSIKGIDDKIKSLAQEIEKDREPLKVKIVSLKNEQESMEKLRKEEKKLANLAGNFFISFILDSSIKKRQATLRKNIEFQEISLRTVERDYKQVKLKFDLKFKETTDQIHTLHQQKAEIEKDPNVILVNKLVDAIQKAGKDSFEEVTGILSGNKENKIFAQNFVRENGFLRYSNSKLTNLLKQYLAFFSEKYGLTIPDSSKQQKEQSKSFSSTVKAAFAGVFYSCLPTSARKTEKAQTPHL